ncbi:hypothetical protein F5Y16DRAFT_363173 [Xylariaceae sp. FL0255]|nr:hypothetical protein F5Y16DRAFT_363173 [Xylariaceae sp. FL0255]
MASKFQESSHFSNASSNASVHGARAEPAANVDNDDASSLDDHVQEKPAPVVPLTKWQKTKQHVIKHKWWYLLLAIILLAILLPILFTLIIPAITQDIVNSQGFPVHGGTFQVISPTQLNVSLQTQLDTQISASLSPTTLDLYNKDTPTYSPFFNVTLPALKVYHKTPVILTDETVTITNQSELIKFFNRVFDQPDVDISIKGKAEVHLGALHMQSKVSKTIQAGALNGLSGFGITDLKLNYPAHANGSNIYGAVNLPNAGVLTLGLGNLTLNLYSGSVRLGIVYLNDVVLPPGNNSRYFNGELFLDELVPNLGTILDSQSAALAQGNIQLNATGNATMYNSEHIAYVEQVLNYKTLTSSLSVITLLGDVISSFSGNGASLSDLLGDTLGNSTFLEGLLSNFNTTLNGTSTQKAINRESTRLKIPASKSLLKLGLKYALSQL